MTDSASPVVDLDLRLVGYFVAVAEHRHFGRAATELRVPQPSLSRQIRRLEQQMGVRLFDRTPQSTRLTEAGEVFLPRAKALLRAAAQAAAQARDAAQPSRITIGYTTCMIITPAVRALRREHPDADVQTVHLDWNQPRDALLDHRVDAVVAHCPFPPTSWTSRSSTTSPGWCSYPSTIASRAGNRSPSTTSPTNPYRNFETAIRPGMPSGASIPGPTGAGTRRSTLRNPRGRVGTRRLRAGGCRHDRVLRGLRPDITTVPLEGVEPGHVVVASRAGDRSRLVAAFRKLAEVHLTAPVRN